VGPFYGFALPALCGPDLVNPASPGALRIEGQVLDGAGDLVPDALLELWQGGPEPRFGRCASDLEGLFHFVTIKPASSPAPDGTLQAPHLHLTVFARGLRRHLMTRIYFPDQEAANASDPVLALLEPGRRSLLVATPVSGGLRFDVNLQGERETPFFAF
jgi:protocatechuate 3,4-dioxygenase alpha subunit